MPFRSARPQNITEKPETGAVAEMVRQFADPYAFVRELVQNSIDAGATTLTIRVERAGSIATIALQDDGTGMTRETIDGPLLTLFNSSKEGDSSKIGKYGVGFVSVFAIDPDTVEVDTWRDGERHRIRLFRDHRYEIEKLTPLEDSGTTVTLFQPMDAEKFDEHRKRLETALARWCRFAAVPIEFVSVDHDRNDPEVKRRIDLPLSVPSSLYVQAHKKKERFVVGPSAGTDRFLTAGVAEDDPAKSKATFAGFYNRGLTLFETDEPLHPSLTNIRFRVDSPSLRHTLSRDNVLRDKAFERIISETREIVQKSLRRELTSRLTRAAKDLAKATPPYEPEILAAYAAFLEAALTHPLDVPYDEISIPLAAPWRDSDVISLEKVMTRKNMYGVSEPDELSAALTKAGIPVVLAPDQSIQSLLSMRVPLPGLISPANNFVLGHEVAEKELSRSDKALCLDLENILFALGFRVRPVSFVTTNSTLEIACILGQKPTKKVGPHSWLSPREHAVFGWTSLEPDGPLLLVASNEGVRLAREYAVKNPFIAAHMLTRLLLLSKPDKYGTLSDALFSIAAVEVV